MVTEFGLRMEFEGFWVQESSILGDRLLGLESPRGVLMVWEGCGSARAPGTI